MLSVKIKDLTKVLVKGLDLGIDQGGLNYLLTLARF